MVVPMYNDIEIEQFLTPGTMTTPITTV